MLIDGQRSETLPASDRGLQYGDGVFETLAVVDGGISLWDAHMERLQRGCERLGFPCPLVTLLSRESEQLCAGVDSGVLKIVVTRGVGGRGYCPPEAPQPRRILSVHPFPDYPAVWWREGAPVRICRTRVADQPALAGIKHLNRLEQVMARSEWTDPSIAEGLMLSGDGKLVEGTMSNVFAVVDGRVLTPLLARGGVDGVMRRFVMELIEQTGKRVHETDLDLDALDAASEVFLTNSVMGLWPVRAIDARPIPVGPWSSWLLARLAEGRVAGIPQEGTQV